MLVVVSLTVLSLFIIESELSTTNDYGPYTASWQKFETCKGPKSSDCGVMTLGNTQNMSDITVFVDLSKDCPFLQGKITTGLINTNTENKLWNYIIEKPCQHFVLGPIICDAFNVTQNKCKVNKGHYEVHVNMLEISHKFFGKGFFYGTYTFKILGYNKVSNFFCIHTVMDIKRKI